jgi:hypothetical protein
MDSEERPMGKLFHPRLSAAAYVYGLGQSTPQLLTMDILIGDP